MVRRRKNTVIAPDALEPGAIAVLVAIATGDYAIPLSRCGFWLRFLENQEFIVRHRTQMTPARLTDEGEAALSRVLQ